MVKLEPRILKRGKQFHQMVQGDWLKTAKDGRINIEQILELKKQRKVNIRKKIGRMDILVNEMSDYVSIVEIKSTNWDLIKPQNIQKLLSSHQRQVWKYIEAFINRKKIDVCPGIIYSHSPKSKYLQNRVEDYLNSYGLQVVWYKDSK